jgi:hypothetical protein
MRRHLAKVTISYELLRESLGIPETVNLVMVISRDNDKLLQTVDLVFEHDDFPETMEGSHPWHYESMQEVLRLTDGR